MSVRNRVVVTVDRRSRTSSTLAVPEIYFPEQEAHGSRAANAQLRRWMVDSP